MNWFSILRLGLVQLCIGSSVVIPLSTLNRLMKVELANSTFIKRLSVDNGITTLEPMQS